MIDDREDQRSTKVIDERPRCGPHMLKDDQRNVEDTWRHILAYRQAYSYFLAFGWLTLNRILFTPKYTCQLLFRAGILASRRQESFVYLNQVISPDNWLGIKNSQNNSNCDRTQQVRKGQGARSRDDSSGQKARIKQQHIGQGDLLGIQVAYIK